MWLIHTHTRLTLGSTLHQRAYINAVLGMLGGTRTSHAGNWSRCGQQKPTRSHAGICLPAEGAAEGNVSFRASEQNLTSERAYFVSLSTPDLGGFLGAGGMKGEGGWFSEHLLSIYVGFQKWSW